jgi:hypothetical protein
MTIPDLLDYVSHLGNLQDQQYIDSTDVSVPLHLPYDSISQLFLFCLSILGLYILFCLQQKN